MLGRQTELTARLEPSIRQFFQWHLREKRPISETKLLMDELTQALRDAGHEYNFAAEEKDWKGRSRHWNKTGKDAWRIEREQMGRDLPIPAKLADVSVWIEWGQDVGNWRNGRSGKDHSSRPSAPQADEYEDPYQYLGCRDGRTGYATATGYPFMSNRTEGVSATLHFHHAGTTAWQQQIADPFPHHMSSQTPSASASGPTVPLHTYGGQSGYQNSYPPQPPKYSTHLHHGSAEPSATQGIPHWAMPELT